MHECVLPIITGGGMKTSSGATSKSGISFSCPLNFEDIIQHVLPEVIHPVAMVGSLEYKEELAVFGAIQDVYSCPAGRISICDHTLGKISQEVVDPYACVLMTMRRDGRIDDILWESHLLVAKGIDQVLECVVSGRSHALLIADWIHIASCQKS